jgi:hypothetical protein
VHAGIDRTAVTCRTPGPAFVLTPLPDRNRDSVEDELRQQGFRKAALAEFPIMLLRSGEANLVTVFQKELEAGETVRFGKWGVLVY